MEYSTGIEKEGVRVFRYAELEKKGKRESQERKRPSYDKFFTARWVGSLVIILKEG